MKDITNQKFGRLTAIKIVGYTKSKQAIWKFVCVCGNYHVTRGTLVIQGKTRSCGCLKKELLRQNSFIMRNLSKGNLRHGFASSRFYKIWVNMNERCKNCVNNRYKRYGQRGIKCYWNSFEKFKDDMYESYQSHVKQFGETNTSIDRIDNDGHYCRENCRWATHIEQGMNTSTNKIIKFNGHTKPLKQWCYDFSLHYGTTWSRIKRGWSVEKALTTPVKGR